MIRREDGSWLYMLPSVVDDVEMGVTHVVRGEDHVTNTGLQLQMFAALDAPAPAFAHEALLTGSEGKLAKRLGSLGVEALREAGIEPEALLAKLARIGTSLPVEPVAEPAPLIAGFDFATFGRAPARFDLAELEALNARIVHQLPFDRVRERLPAGMGRGGLGGDPAQSQGGGRGGRLVGHPARSCRAGGGGRGSRLPRRSGAGRRSARLVGGALAAARRRGSRRAAAAPASRYSTRCAARSPGATAARKWRPCSL